MRRRRNREQGGS